MISTKIPSGEIFSFLPHEGYARFVEEILEVGEKKITCSGRIPRKSPFAEKGRVPAYVAIDLAAQASGILEAKNLAREGFPIVPKSRFVVTVRDIFCSCVDFPAGELLIVQVHLLRKFLPIQMFEFTTSHGNQVILRGTFTTFSS